MSSPPLPVDHCHPLHIFDGRRIVEPVRPMTLMDLYPLQPWECGEPSRYRKLKRQAAPRIEQVVE